MIDLYNQSSVTDDDRRAWANSFRADSSDAFSSSFGLAATTDNPLVSLGSWMSRKLMSGGEDDVKLSVEDANKYYGDSVGVKFDEPIYESEAAVISDRQKKRLATQEVVDAADSQVASIAGSLTGSFVDPINLLFMVAAPEVALLKRIPVLGKAMTAADLALDSRSAVLAGRATAIDAGVGAAESMGIRAAKGAAFGTAGAAFWEPFQVALDQAEYRPYRLEDSLFRLSMGAAFGTLLTTGLGTAGDAFTHYASADERMMIKQVNDVLMSKGKQPIIEEAITASKKALDVQADHMTRFTIDELGRMIKGRLPEIPHIFEMFQKQLDEVKALYSERLQIPEEFRPIIAEISDRTYSVLDVIDAMRPGKSLSQFDDADYRKAVISELNKENIAEAASELSQIRNKIESTEGNLKERLLGKIDEKIREISLLGKVLDDRAEFLDVVRLEEHTKLMNKLKALGETSEVFIPEARLQNSYLGESVSSSLSKSGQTKNIDDALNKLKETLFKKTEEGDLDAPKNILETEKRIIELPETIKKMGGIVDCALKYLSYGKV